MTFTIFLTPPPPLPPSMGEKPTRPNLRNRSPRDPARCRGYPRSWRRPPRPWPVLQGKEADRSAMFAATAETTGVAEGAAGAAGASRRRSAPRPGRCQDTTPPPSSINTRSCSAGSCATPDAIASARGDAASSTTGKQTDVLQSNGITRYLRSRTQVCTERFLLLVSKSISNPTAFGAKF